MFCYHLYRMFKGSTTASACPPLPHFILHIKFGQRPDVLHDRAS